MQPNTNNTSKNEINVEANLPVVAGELRPWKRGSLLSANSIAKFYPAEAQTGWTPGGQFRVVLPTRGIAYSLQVERRIPAVRIPARGELHTSGTRKHWRWTEARTMPEVIVVRVLAVEAVRT